MEINEREKHPMIKCTSYSRGQVRFERDLCFMIMLTTQSFSFTACSYPKVVLPMSILLQYTSYVTYTHIYLIRLFQKVPRGQAVVEPPFKVRLFPSLKIANARMEKSIYMVPCKVPCYINHRDLKKQALVGKFFKFDLGNPVQFVVVLEQFC